MTTKGSILAYSLIILTIMVVTAAAISLSSVTLNKEAGSTDFSVQALQAADSGVQLAMNEIKAADFDDQIQTFPGASCNPVTGNFEWKTNSANLQNAIYEITLYGSGGTSSGPLACNARVSDIRFVKSTGKYKRTARAVSVAYDACGGETSANDSEGNPYPIIAIGNQCWFQKNLNIGSRIAGGTNQGNNCSAGNIHKYCYGDDDTNCTNEGGLYQWNQIMCGSVTAATRGICPLGWHVPTDEEYDQLEEYVCESEGTSATCSTDFNSNATDWLGTDEGKLLRTGINGFAALLAGQYNAGFSLRTSDAFFWTSSENGGTAWGRRLTTTRDDVWHSKDEPKANAYSVRCIKGAGV